MAETASIATNSSANTFIVKSDDGLKSSSNYGMITQNSSSKLNLAGNSNNSNLTVEAVDLIEESLSIKPKPRVSDHVHYHDSAAGRGSGSVGLGLAPPLSSLIMSSNIKVVQVSQCARGKLMQPDLWTLCQPVDRGDPK